MITCPIIGFWQEWQDGYCAGIGDVFFDDNFSEVGDKHDGTCVGDDNVYLSPKSLQNLK